MCKDTEPRTLPEDSDSLKWFDGKKVIEIDFCEEFLTWHPMCCIHGRFFTADGPIPDDVVRRLIYDEMTVEQKRAAIRTVVCKVIWDGQYAHVVLFGAVDEDVDWRDAADVLPALDICNPEDGNEEDTEDLESFGNVDYENAEPSNDIPAETPWGEDSKCYPHKNTFLGIPVGTAERICRPLPKWKVFARVSPDFYILCRTDHGKPRFAPLAAPVPAHHAPQPARGPSVHPAVPQL